MCSSDLCTITSVCMSVLQDDIYHHANVEMMYFIAHTVCACDKLNHSLLSLAVSVLEDYCAQYQFVEQAVLLFINLSRYVDVSSVFLVVSDTVLTALPDMHENP